MKILNLLVLIGLSLPAVSQAENKIPKILDGLLGIARCSGPDYAPIVGVARNPNDLTKVYIYTQTLISPFEPNRKQVTVIQAASESLNSNGDRLYKPLKPKNILSYFVSKEYVGVKDPFNDPKFDRMYHDVEITFQKEGKISVIKEACGIDTKEVL